ncbi:methyltransferase domain-containing protein [Dichotomocladium elegans]|nr:methyltransferase domain-containing protein [Dichotomocladium elegans]
MTSKKIHEVELMSTLIHDVAKERGISHVLDLGSGQGYLSRALAFQHDMNVLAVDMSEIQTRGAMKFDRRAIRAAEKKNKLKEVGQMKEPKKLQHVTEMITPENVSSVLTRWGSNDGESKPWLICGLHTCGDLSPMIMRLFAESKDQVACLVNVGCCYHYLADGFPLSDSLKQRGYKLSTTARVLACHSPWQWIHEMENCRKLFEQHFSRALLQQIMADKGLSSTVAPPTLGKPFNKEFDFGAYVQKALKKFGAAPDAISPEEANMYYARYKNQCRADRQITVLWTLRSLLAPVLESLILMDRWLYLRGVVSKGSGSPKSGVWMWPLFDPYESPRNVVFVASK